MKSFKLDRFLKRIHDLLSGSYEALYGLVLHFFKSLNRKVLSTLPFLRMKEETSEHVHATIKVFKWIILPASIIYTCANFLFFNINALDSAFWSLIVFLYSCFLPDLPSIFRAKNRQEIDDAPWYKKYALLLFAPLLIWALFSGIRLEWKTTETFHNLKSLTVYSVFLFCLGFLGFGTFPLSIVNIAKVLPILIYGVVGYLTHLKIDKLW